MKSVQEYVVLCLLWSGWVKGFLSSPSFRSAKSPCSLREWRAASEDSDNMDNSSSNRTTITRDMLLKDMLQDPVVKRKKKGSSYKVLDNRDSLPFQVEIASPDPYTPKEKKQKNINRVKRIPNAVENTIQSKLYMEEGDDAHQTPLGDYLLDKHTTTGDLLEIQGTRYKVVRHKCQYKYAGGKRFVMVRKILQVKEVGRVQAEEYLARQWKNSKDVE